MEILGQYVLSIVAASIISAVIMGFFQGGTVKQLLKMICGLFLAFAVIRPIQEFDVRDLAFPGETAVQEGEDLAAMGQELATEALAEIIKAETQAYILDKAAQWNLSLEVVVTVSGEPPVPVRAELSGSVSPYLRERLEAVLAEELGIPKENQIWNGEA